MKYLLRILILHGLTFCSRKWGYQATNFLTIFCIVRILGFSSSTAVQLYPLVISNFTMIMIWLWQVNFLCMTFLTISLFKAFCHHFQFISIFWYLGLDCFIWHRTNVYIWFANISINLCPALSFLQRYLPNISLSSQMSFLLLSYSCDDTVCK